VQEGRGGLPLPLRPLEQLPPPHRHWSAKSQSLPHGISCFAAVVLVATVVAT
jgi:hypothetical protein